MKVVLDFCVGVRGRSVPAVTVGDGTYETVELMTKEGVWGRLKHAQRGLVIDWLEGALGAASAAARDLASAATDDGDAMLMQQARACVAMLSQRVTSAVYATEASVEVKW